MNDQQQNTPRTIKLATLFIIVMAAITVISMVIVLRWAYQPSQVLEVKNSPVSVVPPEVKDGGKVYLNIDFCKTSGTHGVTDVHLVGAAGAKIAIDWPEDRTPAGCNHYPEVPVSIPGQTPSDTYHVEFLTCYDVNPLKQNRCSIFTSQQFKVINSKLNPGDAKVQKDDI